jgi:SAM-dependent methyltransferase
VANRKGSEVDTTFLSLDRTRVTGFIHRDYLAHCMRWSHVVSYLRRENRCRTHHVLDVGCGREAPLPRVMYSRMLTHTTGSYTGVDYGPVEHPPTIPRDTPKFKATFLQKFDFTKDGLPRDTYDTVTCFEMLEHVEPWHSYLTLARVRDVLEGDGRAFVSTPVYSVEAGPAANHVNEMSFAGLSALIGMAGLEVERVHGTFASQRDYKHLLPPEWRRLYDELSAYHYPEVLACLFAPLYPEQSRNCLWVLKRGDVIVPKDLKTLSGSEHSSSERWAADLTKIARTARKNV